MNTHRMSSICPVLWGVCKRERVGVTWLHFPSAMVPVSRGEAASPSQQLPSCSVTEITPALWREGGCALSVLMNPREAKQETQQILQPDWLFIGPCSDVYCRGLIGERISCHKLGKHLRLSINLKNRNLPAECADSLPCCWWASCFTGGIRWPDSPSIPDFSTLVGKYFSFTFF